MFWKNLSQSWTFFVIEKFIISLFWPYQTNTQILIFLLSLIINMHTILFMVNMHQNLDKSHLDPFTSYLKLKKWKCLEYTNKIRNFYCLQIKIWQVNTYKLLTNYYHLCHRFVILDTNDTIFIKPTQRCTRT